MSWNLWRNTHYCPRTGNTPNHMQTVRTLWSQILEETIVKPGQTKKEICATINQDFTQSVCVWKRLIDENMIVLKRNGRRQEYYPTQRGIRTFNEALDESDKLYQHLATLEKVRYIRSRLEKINQMF